MNFITKQLIFCILSIGIYHKELSSLPHPAYFFKVFFNSDSNSIQFIFWVFWAFLIAPIIYYSLVITLNLKYGMVEPENVKKLAKSCQKSYVSTLINSVSILMGLFYLTYTDDVFLYSVLRYSAMFPKVALSNIIYIQLFDILCVNFGISFLYITACMTLRIMSRISNLANLRLFLYNNMECLIGLFAITAFYMFNVIYIHFMIYNVSNETASVIESILSLTTVYTFMIFPLLKQL